MGNWGDDYDPEVINKKEPKGRVTLNFKKISADIDEIIEGTATVDEKHPREDILKEWLGVMISFYVIFLVAYKIFAFFTVPFIAFYLIALYKVFKAWKFFKYRMLPLTLGTVFCLGFELATSLYIQHFYPF